MKKEDIEHLARLARIELTEEEKEQFAGEFDGIIHYVEQLKDIAASDSGEKKTGPHYNVLREDTKPHGAGMYTEDLLNAAPSREGQYLSVKKIIDNG